MDKEQEAPLGEWGDDEPHSESGATRADRLRSATLFRARMPQEPAPSRTPSLHGAVRAVSGVTLLSRVGGLVREVLVARLFGNTLLGSSFAAAFQIPNLFRRLFGEGALSAAFLPAYTDAKRESAASGAKLASLTLAWLGAATAGLAAVIEVVLLLILLFVPHTPDRELSLKLVMVMIPFMPAICSAAILAGMLQVHGRFGPASSGPLILNAFIVVVAAFYLFTGQAAGETVAYGLGAATVLSGFTQCFWFARLLREQVRWTRDWNDAKPHARVMMKKFGPVALGLGTLQLNAFVDMLIAMYPIWFGATLLGYLYPLDEQSNAVLTAAQRLYQFPLGVFGIAVATAVFPMLAANSKDPAKLVDTLRRGIRLSLFIGVPASIGLALVPFDLTYVLYSGGAKGFDQQGVERSAAALLAYAPGIWVYSLNHVFARLFYATGDTRTPMIVSLWMVLFNILLNFTLIWFVREAGLAWSTTITATIQLAVLMHLAKRRLGSAVGVDIDAPPAANPRLLDRATLRSAGRTVAASVLVGLAVAGMQAVLPPASSWMGHLITLGASAFLGIGVYFVISRVLGAEELRLLLRRSV